MNVTLFLIPCPKNMPPSISERSIPLEQGTKLRLTTQGANIINKVWAARGLPRLRKDSIFTVQATDGAVTHLRRKGHKNAVLSVPDDFDLFAKIPLAQGERVRISKHYTGPDKKICLSLTGRVNHLFTPSIKNAEPLGNARCEECSFTETVGPVSRLPSKT